MHHPVPPIYRAALVWNIVYSSLYGKEDGREIDRNPPGGSPGASVAVPAYTHTHNIYIYSAHGSGGIRSEEEEETQSMIADNLLTSAMPRHRRRSTRPEDLVYLYIFECVCVLLFSDGFISITRTLTLLEARVRSNQMSIYIKRHRVSQCHPTSFFCIRTPLLSPTVQTSISPNLI